MLPRLRYIGRVISLFFRLFIFRSLKVMFLPGQTPRSTPAPAPPVVARAEQKEHYLLVLGFVLVVIVCVALTHLWGVKAQPYITIAGLMAVSLGHKAWKQLGADGVSGLCREARENDRHLCLHCGYNLKGLPIAHRCPECGNPYDIEDVKQKWAAYLTSDRSPASAFVVPPPIVGKLERWHLVCRTAAVIPVLALAAFLMLNGKLLTQAGPVTRIYIYISFLFIPAGMLMAAWVGRKINRLGKQAYSEKYALCPACGYCLKGLPEKHRCPECGTFYEIEDVKRKWSEYLADRAARQLPW